MTLTHSSVVLVEIQMNNDSAFDSFLSGCGNDEELMGIVAWLDDNIGDLEKLDSKME